MADPAVTEIRLDPHPDNSRAIRCYEKAGFRNLGEMATPDGPAVMMVLPRKRSRRLEQALTTFLVEQSRNLVPEPREPPLPG